MRTHDSGRTVHPKLRPSTLRFYTLDEPTVGTAYDLARGKQALQPAYGVAATVVTGCTPYARKFTNPSWTGVIEASADSELVNAAYYNWTAHALIRPRASSSFFPIFGLCGFVDSATLTENALFVVSVTVGATDQDFSIEVDWETSAGATVSYVSSNYAGYLNEWSLVTVRKRDLTALGGNCLIDVFVNGVLISTSGAVVSAGSGTSARFSIGSLEQTGPSQSGNFFGDIAHVSFHAEALSDAEIVEDARRVQLSSFFTRCDFQVLVDKGTTQLIDLTNLDGQGRDVVIGASITDDNENATATASVSLLREEVDSSLAGLRTDTQWNLNDPLFPDDYNTLLREARTLLEIRTGRVPLGLRATARDLFSKFVGYIDEINEGNEKIEVTARDLGGLLIDTFIEEEINYGESAGVYVEAEMQLILNDNDNVSFNNSVSGLVVRNGSYPPISLYTPLPSLWAVKRWRQQREPVLTALRTLAGQIGWEVRYIFDQNLQTWRLTFYQPRRDLLSSAMVISPDDIIDVTNLSRSAFNVRNVVRVVYPSSETSLPTVPSVTGYTITNGWADLDGENNRMAAFIQIESDDSITAFNRRLFCEFAEDGSSQIDTISEAFDMAFGAVRDLEEPEINKSVTLSLTPELDQSDRLYILPVRQLFTAPQNLAITSITHNFGEEWSTTIELRGKPALGFKRWLKLEARPGSARPGVTEPLDALTGIRPGTLLQTIRTVLDRTNYFSGGKFLQIRNPEFSFFSAGRTNPPDGWSVIAGSWATNVSVSSTSRSGNYSVAIDGLGALRSDFIPIPGDATFPLSLEVVWQRLTGDDFLQADLEWYTAAKVLISTTQIFPGSGTYGFPAVPVGSGAWFTSRAQGFTPPAAGTARFVKITLRARQNTAPINTILVDSVSLYRTARAMQAGATSLGTWGYTTIGTTYYNQPFGDVITSPFYDRGSQFVAGTGGGVGLFGYCFVCKEPGTYRASVSAYVVNVFGAISALKTTEMQIVKNGLYNGASSGARQSGTVVATQQLSSTWTNFTFHSVEVTLDLVEGDRVSVDLRHLSGGGGNIVTGSGGGSVQLSNFLVRLAQAD